MKRALKSVWITKEQHYALKQLSVAWDVPMSSILRVKIQEWMDNQEFIKPKTQEKRE